MNAIELLKEARAELAKAHDHLMELTAKLPMQYFGLVDGNIIQSEDCFVDKIDAYLAAPSENATGEKWGPSTIDKIRQRNADGDFTLDYWRATELIEGYGRRVPKAMLLELLRRFWPMGNETQYAKVIADLAAKYGVGVEG